MQQKLALAQENLEHYRRLAAHPKLSLRAALAARNSERSWQAAVTLAEKALRHEQSKQAP